MKTPYSSLLVSALVCAGVARAATDVRVAFTLNTTDADGAAITENRYYSVYRPDNLPKTTPVPMVLVMEASAGSGAAGFFHRKADQAGFVVVSCAIPGNSLRNVWNSGNPRLTGFEDYDYTNSVISRVAQAENCTDAFICGLSKGGHVSYAYACERPATIRAACSVDEFMGLTSNLPVAPVPILALHGTVDTNVPYTMAKDSVDAWRATDGLMAATPTTTYESSPLIPGRVTQATWRSTGGGPPVAMVTIVGGSHVWPGPTTQTGYDCTDGIWTFFSQFLTSTQPAPKIVSQPVNHLQLRGQPASFWVSATGTAPLRYQWQKNGAELSGATSNWFTTPPTTAADNGTTYRCVITNGFGRATSTAASLTIRAAAADPVIAAQPENQTVIAGKPASFSVRATGTMPLSYQWKKNGVNLPAATSATLALPATLTADCGSLLSVAVSNPAGMVTSAGATLTVKPADGAPVILLNPERARAVTNQTATFKVVAQSPTPMTYQWQQGAFTTNMTDIPGATAAIYTTPPAVLSAHRTLVRCVVSNSSGGTTSASEMLFVTAAPRQGSSPAGVSP